MGKSEMTIARRIAEVSANIETAARMNEFIQATKFLMIGRRAGAERLAEEAKAPLRVIQFVKAAQSAGSISGSWGSSLALQSLATAFLSSLTGVSAFDALWPNMLQVPLRTSVVAVSAILSAGSIAEASIKPASRLSLSASELDAVKAAAFIAVSAELLKLGGPMATALLERELRTAIARATNSIFLPILTANAPSFASSGVAALGVRQDLRTLVANVSSGANSKLFLIVTRKIAEAWSVLPDASGAAAFPTVTVNGGTIGGMTIVVVDEATDGEIILVDATQVAAGSEGLVLDNSMQATLQLDAPADSPVSASTVMTSVWQNNLAAIKAERYIGAKLLRPDAVAKIIGAAYSGNSPA
jgi:HK97 family phage major capsid protein